MTETNHGLFLILSILTIFQVVLGKGSLRFVAVLYRHGDRTPTKTYPKDPYRNISFYWPDGLGELTNLGVRRQYELGLWLRDRYGGFLPEKFNSEDIYVRSSDSDRTLMSAAANLAGLYPPKATQVWDRNLLWRPIPIHTVPSEDDEVIAMKRECLKYDTLYEQLLNSSFFKNIDVENRQLYNFLSLNTGWNITQIRQIETLYSLLSIEKQYNLTLPSWTSAVYPKKLKHLAVLSHASFSFTRELAKLKNGPFFDYIFAHFDMIIKNSSRLKFLMMSGHDNTIVNVLSAMGVYDYTCPDFASIVIWELKESRGKFYVNLFYKNGTNFSKLKLFECDVNCEYSTFKDILQPVTLNLVEWKKECLDIHETARK